MTLPTAAQDCLGRASLIIGGDSAKIQSAKAINAQNVLASIQANWSGSGDAIVASANLPILVGRLPPDTDTTYDDLPVGSIFLLEEADSTHSPVIKDSAIYIKKHSGWEKVLTGSNSISSTALSAAGELARIWGQTAATSGIFRGLSVRTYFSAAGTATGDAGRFYNLTNVSVGNMHGIHSTAQLGAEDAASVGTVTGQAAGVRATIGIGLTNTAPAGGTLAALRADSYFQSSAAGAQSSFLYMTDVNATYGVDAIIRCGPIVDRSTDAAALKAYTYEAGGITAAATAAKIALRVVTQDGTFYLLGWAAGEISAT